MYTGCIARWRRPQVALDSLLIFHGKSPDSAFAIAPGTRWHALKWSAAHQSVARYFSHCRDHPESSPDVTPPEESFCGPSRCPDVRQTDTSRRGLSRQVGLCLRPAVGIRSGVQSLRTRIITARPGMTFSELARFSQPGRFAEGHLLTLNGLYPGGEPVAGPALKIIE